MIQLSKYSRSSCATPWLSVVLGGLIVSAAATSFAQPAAASKLPLKKVNPLVDQKALSIPGALPSLKARPLKVPQANKLLKPRPAKPKPVKSSPPPRKYSGSSSSSGGDSSSSKYAALKVKSRKCDKYRGKRFNFDFNGDLKELVEMISEMTCKNFILTNKVRGQKFKILSPQQVTVQEAWLAFLSALQANDYTLMRSGRYYKVFQASEGNRNPVPLFRNNQRVPNSDRTIDSKNGLGGFDRVITKIYRLKHGGDPNATVNYLNIFKSNRGQLHPFTGTGTIIVTDFASSIKRLERILQEIDQPGALEQIHVLNVEFSSASEIAEKLTQIFEPQNSAARKNKRGGSKPRLAKLPKNKRRKTIKGESSGGGGEEGPNSVSKILADDRTNKIIIIASSSAFKQIKALMRELDVPEDGTDGQIHVLRLKHADAEELASTLASLSQGRPTSSRRSSRKSKRAKKSTGSAALFQGEVKVTADKATNSLVITASKSDIASIRRVIDRLDVPRYQVFVEAVIMEVSTNRDRDLGMGFHGGFPVNINGEDRPVLLGSTPAQSLSSFAAALNPVGLAALPGLVGSVSGPPVPGSEGIIPGGIPSLGVVVNALASNDNVNVVSSPHLLTMDNEEAEIQVSEKRPFSQGLTLGLGGLGGGQAGGASLAGLGLGSLNITREDIGLTLKLKPQINDEDYVRLEIDQELSDVAGVDAATSQVITSKRSAKTTVVVRNQDSVVIGGLVRDRETINESKIPLLGDLPLVGWLFKRQQKSNGKVNLVLIITPYIIRDPADFQRIFERKLDERKEFVDRFYGHTKEYRAKIDWTRKVGPLAAYQQSIQKELSKAENGGRGTPGQIIIRAEDEVPEGDAPAGDAPAPEGTEGPIGEELPPVSSEAAPAEDTPAIEP